VAAGSSLTTPQTLLEISTRPYLYELSKRYGKSITKLSEIPDEVFDEWQSKGFKWVWFMGVWQLGDYGLNHDRTDPNLKKSYDSVLPGWTNDDVIGSPYAIVKYEVNTQIGTASDLAAVRTKLHNRGMKLMLDFVPNHSAYDCPDVTDHINYYIRAPQGTSDPSKYFDNGVAYGCGQWCDPWTDVAQLNYFDQDFRAARIETLKTIASVCDGMRCDMAHLILNDVFGSCWSTELSAWGYSTPSTEFWSDAISAVKKEYPDCIFMAEAYGDNIATTLAGLGFDYIYDKEAIDSLKNHDVQGLINKFKSADLNHLAHFTENHDEPRSMETFWNYAPASDAASAALLSLPGVRFVFQDQWYGYAKKLDVHLRRALSENPNNEVVAFFNAFLPILGLDSVSTGTFSIQTYTGANTVLTWKWVKGTEHVLFCINFGEAQAWGNIICDDAPETGATIPVQELISGVTYYRDPKEMKTTGLVVGLDAYQVQVFKY